MRVMPPRSFDDDGGIEMPYLTDFGYPGEFRHPEGITVLTNFLQQFFPGLSRENLNILIVGASRPTSSTGAMRFSD